MIEYLISNTTLEGIANAVRTLSGDATTVKYTPSQMIEKIITNVPPAQEDTLPVYQESKALEAVSVAKTYWTARAAGREFVYDTDGVSFLNGDTVNDENGKGKIDCSTYIHLVMRGIPYENSPYVDTTPDLSGSPDLISTNPTGKYGWGDDTLKNSNTVGGIVRTAADMAKYYWAKGRVFTDASKLKPGDLTFHSGHTNSRFKNITHIGIVTEDVTKMYNVTDMSNVVVRTNLSSRGDIVFYARPDYENHAESPIDSGYNWMASPWLLQSQKTQNGISITPDLSEGTITTKGTASASNSITIISSSYPWRIPKGTYKLTGAPARTDRGSRVDYKYWGLRLYPLDGRNIVSRVTGFIGASYIGDTTTVEQNEAYVWDKGYGAIFTIDSDMDFHANIYISKYVKDDRTVYTGPDVWEPKLVKIAEC